MLSLSVYANDMRAPIWCAHAAYNGKRSEEEGEALFTEPGEDGGGLHKGSRTGGDAIALVILHAVYGQVLEAQRQHDRIGVQCFPLTRGCGVIARAGLCAQRAQ